MTSGGTGMSDVNADLREAYREAKRDEDDRLVDLVLGSQLVPRERIDGGMLELATPKDFELEHRGKFRLLRVEVSVTHFLGERTVHPDEDDSPIWREVTGVVQPLNKDWTPNQRKPQEQIGLPEELAKQLIGMVVTAP